MIELAIVAIGAPAIAGALVYLGLSRIHAREIEVYGRLLTEERQVSKTLHDRLMARDYPEYVQHSRPRTTGVRVLTDRQEREISERQRAAAS